MRGNGSGGPGSMTFDAERLRRWSVPEVCQKLTRRDTVLYALSTGFGDNPVEPDVLKYVDPAAEDLMASPSMALVLAYPGFWLANPTLGIDATRLLHVGQSITLYRPLPVEGEVTGRVVVLDVTDRGAGRGTLVTSERMLLLANRPLARLVQTHLLRSEGGFSGGATPKRLHDELPGSAPDFDVQFTLPANAALLYRINGDLNPVHADPETARSAGFERPIMHGMGTLGYVVRHLVRTIGSGSGISFKELHMNFASPVLPGEFLRLRVWRNGQFTLTAEERLAGSGGFKTSCQSDQVRVSG